MTLARGRLLRWFPGLPIGRRRVLWWCYAPAHSQLVISLAVKLGKQLA
jgi:hypothetical protein